MQPTLSGLCTGKRRATVQPAWLRVFRILNPSRNAKGKCRVSGFSSPWISQIFNLPAVPQTSATAFSVVQDANFRHCPALTCATLHFHDIFLHYLRNDCTKQGCQISKNEGGKQTCWRVQSLTGTRSQSAYCAGCQVRAKVIPASDVHRTTRLECATLIYASVRGSWQLYRLQFTHLPILVQLNFPREWRIRFIWLHITPAIYR